MITRIFNQQETAKAIEPEITSSESSDEEPKKKRARRPASEEPIAIKPIGARPNKSRKEAPARTSSPAPLFDKPKNIDNTPSSLDSDEDTLEDLGREEVISQPEVSKTEETVSEIQNSDTDNNEQPENDNKPSFQNQERPAQQAPENNERPAQPNNREDASSKIKRNYNNYVREFDGLIVNEGVLEIMQDGGYGFLSFCRLQLPCKP